MANDKNYEIGEILDDFEKNKNIPLSEKLAPPSPSLRDRQGIDFSAESENSAEGSTADKPKAEKAPASKAVKECAEKIKKALFSKKGIAVICVILVVVATAFAVPAIYDYSKSAYLNPYRQKYPDVTFPVGIMEKYCDLYGENPNAVGCLKIDDIQLDTPVFAQNSKKSPYEQGCKKGAQRQNFVVYIDDNRLEELYKSPDAYNKSNVSAFVQYSDLYSDYTFKIVGAFYINTDEKDDNGYVFPYNTTEKLTEKSSSTYISAVNNRMIYSTGVTLTRQDKLIFLSCDTDYKDNFRFVAVGVLSDKKAQKPTAQPKQSPWYPQSVCDDMGIDNTYKMTPKWYPEILENK